MKPSHDDLQDRQQRAAEHWERCGCWRARLGKRFEPRLTRLYMWALLQWSKCARRWPGGA